MPINEATLGKYIRPGIYIEEVDKSQFVEPPVQEVLTNLVPGFSRKGPFNKPVKVSNANEFVNIFGDIDRNLENKGSYFHKTVLNMLERGPIWAINLLKTDPDRDKVDWKSISVAAQYDNGTTKRAPYEYMFNRQDFWTLDTDEFLDVVNDDNGGVEVVDKLLHITNLQDRDLTVFIFKSPVLGFDVTAEFWYGGRENVPLYMSPYDWISDYLISILVIGGDWTSYDKLAVDPYWNKYFTVKGLKKGQVQNFANDKNITAIAYYDASLIPNFQDLNGKKMYVTDLINAETDRTGLFCAYNEDAILSQDFPMGRIDIIGQTLVGSSKKDINFMSYQDSILENRTFVAKDLDTVGNVFGNYYNNTEGSEWKIATYEKRQNSYTNWLISGMTAGTKVDDIDLIASLSSDTITLDAATEAVVGDIVYFSKTFGPVDATKGYYVTYKSTNDIKVSATLGGPSISFAGVTNPGYVRVYVLKVPYTCLSTGFYYNIGSSHITGTTITAAYLNPFVLNNTGGTYSRYDVIYMTTDYTQLYTISGLQVSGGSASMANFTADNENSIILGYTYTLYHNNSFTITYSPIAINTSTGYVKLPITFSSGTTNSVNYIDINFVGSSGATTTVSDYGRLRMLKYYDEMVTKLATNKSVIINYSNGSKYYIEDPTFIDATTTTDAIIRIYMGTENIENYVRVAGTTVPANEILIYYIDDEFIASGTIGHMTSDGTNNQYKYDISIAVHGSGCTIGKYSALYQDFYDGYISNYDYFYVGNDSSSAQKVYIKGLIDADGYLQIDFLTQYYPTELPATITWSNYVFDDGTYGLIIYSDLANYKQVLDVVNSGITDTTNTRTIYFDKTRYSEVIRGNFLEAYYDTTYYDSPGEGYLLGEVPRKLTRIIDVKNAADGVNKIISTDAPIKLYTTTTGGTDYYYTNVYTQIDGYFDEYKGLFLQAFKIDDESIPNGTDARLDTILSVVDKDTKLAKALANKNRISWRYLVDSFGLGLTEYSKQEFVDMCGMKLNCLGFINMPSLKQLKRSVNPSFINTDNTLNTEYLKKGGDDTKNPDFYYSYGTGVGQSCTAYFFPFVKDVDDTTRFYPPSSYAARTYMNKFVTSIAGIKPWTIMAGTIYGLIPDVVGTEMNFSDTDLDNMQQMGANPIVYAMNRGYFINSENTAQVWPQSSLSNIHSREILIELENRLYDMLLNYQWRWNNQDSRTEIKYRADQICKEIKDSGALYDFKNVIDKTNNTDTIINAKMGVLDTYVEIEPGMGIIVNQITILRRGVIASGGFLTT